MKAWDFKTKSFRERSLYFSSRLHGDKEAVFDINERRYMKPWSYTKKQRRAFHRCINGLFRAKGRLERMRFMTLTSSPQSDRSKLNYHFNLLVKQIEYTFGFKMQYWKVPTNEGYGVLHVLFRVIADKLPRKRKKGILISKRRRGFVPHSWLSKTWEKIHGAKVVDIHYVKRFLGHKSIVNTEIYINIANTIFESRSDEFTVRVAEKPEDVKRLLEVGFDFVCQKGSLIFLKKRK